jgi:hypothetical protein
VHIATGGVGDAEGAAWLSIFGANKQLEKTEEAINTVRSELIEISKFISA